MDLRLELAARILRPQLGEARIGIGIPAQEVERALLGEKLMGRAAREIGAGAAQIGQKSPARELEAFLSGKADGISARELQKCFMLVHISPPSGFLVGMS